MPTDTYTPLANITLSSSASSVTFSSISQAYRDLVLVTDIVLASGVDYLQLRMNGISTNGSYSQVFAEGNGSSTSSSSPVTNNCLFDSYSNQILSSSTRSAHIWQILDYAQTDKHKPTLVRANNSGVAVSMGAGRFVSTNAITSLALNTNSGFQFAAGSTFALYGVSS